MQEFLLITAKATNECICTVMDLSKEGVADGIKYARDYDERDLRSLEQNAIEYPSMSDFWAEQIAKTKKRIEGGYIAQTVEQHVAEERKRLVDGVVKEISQEDFDEALCVLPPMKWIRNERYSMFCMSEMWSYSFTSQYLRDKVTGKCYTTMVDIHDESTWLDKILGL